ncbi:hypothetical protein CAEBREN_24226 [Caenorhabditis brenneri]|uniref:DUF38 domain-containing protein n=1 Tax=Caenorhabditis brenneri TaxID=135651 RepID=G0N777_CAEBE|nr:hypothetical protein CAEBREN_24226 [Caenorhabditis brenneri]
MENKDGCTINTFKENRKITKALKSEDFMGIALKNFENVLINQKSLMVYINVEYHYNCRSQNVVSKFSEELCSILKSRKQKLQVKSFHCTVIDQSQGLDVLSHLDPNSLRYMVIANVRGSSNNLEMLQMGGITNMEFWKNLEMFTTKNFVVDAPIEDFLHLRRVDVAVKVVTAEMVMAVKENFLHSSNMDFFELHFEKNNSEEKLVGLFGQPLREFDGFWDHKQKWFFIIPNDNIHAHSLYFYQNCVYFSRVYLKDVPENAPLIDYEIEIE